MKTEPEATSQNAKKKEVVRLALFTQIVRTHLFMETLETRNSDSLDFKEVAVWSVKKALEAAYQAGYTAGMRKGER
jgi:hypothetical protein